MFYIVTFPNCCYTLIILDYNVKIILSTQDFTSKNLKEIGVTGIVGVL